MSGTSDQPAGRRHHGGALVTCAVCGAQRPRMECVPVAALRPGLQALLRETAPQTSDDAFVCHDDLTRLRARYVTKMLTAERGELTRLEREVIESLTRQDTVSADVETAFTGQRTFGERMSDALASFGGSWTFIGLFLLFMLFWMMVNVLAAARGFDPYPFILLNLVLSCLAAIQAPIIMMSQKRQEAKDRLRSENDYRVNLKAELEIRHLHEKVDHILNRQWDRLAEIQEIQLEMMEDALTRKK